MADTVYRSAHLLVKAFHRGGHTCVITFDAFTDTANLDRPAFGEQFFQNCQISAVHVVNARNRWYHEPDWRHAIAAAHTAARGYRRVVTYGASMGGYAALRFSRDLGAATALALSPQYSRDPNKVPFERRWAAHRREPWLPELSGSLPHDVSAVIVYDPMVAADRVHVDHIAREMTVHRLPLPHAGHGSAAFLAEVGLLGTLVSMVVEGDGDPRSVAMAARERRKQSPHYLIALADAALIRGHLQISRRLAERATHLIPLEEGPWHVLGRIHDRLRAFDDALLAHRRAAKIAPHLPAVQLGLALAQRRAGEVDEALLTLARLKTLPLPGASARFVSRTIWVTRLQRWIAPTGFLHLIRWVGQCVSLLAKAKNARAKTADRCRP